MDWLIELAKEYGFWVLAVALFFYLIRVLMDEDKSALWRGRFYKAAFKVTGKKDKEKKYISNDVKGRLNLARRSMHFGQSILPKAVDVVWVDSTNPEAADIKDGEFVVRLDPAHSQQKNIVSLATLLVHKTTLQGIRHSVDKPIQVAVDMNLVRNLIRELGSKDILDWFISNEYQPTVNADAHSKHRNEQLLAIDERGLFTRLLLVELDEFAKRVYGMAPNQTMANEVASLIDYLHTIVTKQPGQNVPLAFSKTYIRIGIILVAKTGTILNMGVGPYVTAMNENLKAGLQTVYALIFDKDWLGEFNTTALGDFKTRVSLLQDALRTRTIAIKDFALDFDLIDQNGNRRRATCIRYKAPAKP